MDTNITYRSATTSDTRQIVGAHLASFEGFFLSMLGPTFLRHFYDGLIDLESGILHVAARGEDVVGFVGGSTSQHGFYRALLRTRRTRFATAAAAASLRHPSAIRRLLRAGQRTQRDDDAPHPACLMTLGVSPGTEGLGIGTGLVERFESTVFEAGQTGYCLTTDADRNERTNSFYRSRGLELTRVITTPEGRRLNEYAKTFTSTPRVQQ